jgi:hypothetical protein
MSIERKRERERERESDTHTQYTLADTNREDRGQKRDRDVASE